MTSTLRTVSLTTDGGAAWTVQAVEGPVPEANSALLATPVAATVPGEVYTDLLAAGVIPDPFDGDNEGKLHWIGKTSWSYRTTFDWQPDEHAVQELVADGLDTVARVTLNGTELGQTWNQHRSYRFPVTGLLVAGSNELTVEFASPVATANRLREESGMWPHTNLHPYNSIRKMASNFGWDWGIDVATAGIWRPLRIESWTGVRIDSVRPLAGVDGDRGVLDSRVALAWPDGATDEATVTVEVGGTSTQVTVAAGTQEVAVSSTIDAVDRWWPRGHGEQPLYDVAITVSAGDRSHDWQGRVGFRTVTMNVAPDKDGGPFVLAVNGKPIYIHGANWIPDDALLTRQTRETYERSIRDAVDANMNLLRVWGGGIYESDDFYDVCDELGVLVWQDFLFACAAYSEDEPLWSEVEAEAREAVTRLSSHASLALWNGNNENIWGYVEWGWREPLAGRPWGEGYYLDLLPRIVAELDPRTPYSAGSPFSYDRYIHPNDERNGTMHIWDVWNQVDYSSYRKYKPRFVSEFGFQGPPAWSTLTSVVHDEPLDPYGEQMLVHQKAFEGNLKLERGLGDHLPKWRTMDDWHWTTQLNQARAIAYGIEHFRSLFPLNTGAIVWQLNDNWPVVSWAAVDGHGIRKPLWHTLKRVYADRLLSVQPREDGPVVAAHNDTDVAWSTEVTATRRSTGMGSEVLASETFLLQVGARDSVLNSLPESVATPSDPATEYVEVRAADGATAYWYFVEDTSLRVEAVPYSAEITPTADGYDVTVTATALAKDLALFPDRLDAAARVDSCLVTLSAGESHTFHVTGTTAPTTPIDKPVLRSANDLMAG
ncbi:glycoside hydrolase family 2 protein [Kribbella sp. CA-293567]|uniref:glycoside hydrolase family 2 protein n=1 Tax=Kribbella sp. CA-293567 TaxID=3002436 RepID=UPI0022DE5AC6|nr:glycoside hydrolase family 2 protein [Kribbella sp. CA-293567]WBQ06042.1 glycoside hydrolase family 2 protein [Kribbella sp. CA-293567]